MFDNKIILPDGYALNQIIDRTAIRFDQDMICCQSMVRENLFMCLECGQIFAGGTAGSPLLLHYGRAAHTIALNLKTNKVVMLPNYQELSDYKEISDIQFASRPTYTDKVINLILQKQKEGIKINNKLFYPGQLLFDLRSKQSSQLSVIRFISRITPLRDFLLLNPQSTPLANELSRYFKQAFNPYGFRDHISPFTLLRSIQTLSNDKYNVQNEVNPAEYFTFILQLLNQEIPGKIVSKLICGKLNFVEDNNGDCNYTSKIINYWSIPLEPYECPLYRNGLEKEKIIPQATLESLLERYNGTQITVKSIGNRQIVQRKMSIHKSSEFLWINVNRIRPASFGLEKLNLHIVHSDDGSIDLSKYGVNAKYDLVSVISHEGDVNSGVYVNYCKNEAGVWLKCGNSDVTNSMFQVAATSQCCHLLYQRRK